MACVDLVQGDLLSPFLPGFEHKVDLLVSLPAYDAPTSSFACDSPISQRMLSHLWTGNVSFRQAASRTKLPAWLLGGHSYVHIRRSCSGKQHCHGVQIFNPPYVPTPDEELSRTDIARAWAGGNRGRVIIDRFLPQVR